VCFRLPTGSFLAYRGASCKLGIYKKGPRSARSGQTNLNCLLPDVRSRFYKSRLDVSFSARHELNLEGCFVDFNGHDGQYTTFTILDSGNCLSGIQMYWLDRTTASLLTAKIGKHDVGMCQTSGVQLCAHACDAACQSSSHLQPARAGRP